MSSLFHLYSLTIAISVAASNGRSDGLVPEHRDGEGKSDVACYAPSDDRWLPPSTASSLYRLR